MLDPCVGRVRGLPVLEDVVALELRLAVDPQHAQHLQGAENGQGPECGPKDDDQSPRDVDAQSGPGLGGVARPEDPRPVAEDGHTDHANQT